MRRGDLLAHHQADGAVGIGEAGISRGTDGCAVRAVEVVSGGDKVPQLTV